MPAFSWPTIPTPEIQAWKCKVSNDDAGHLLHWAVSCVDALHYLDDLDEAFDRNRSFDDPHRQDVVDLAHARWAAGTCITALDLCAAALGRAFCGHSKTRELDLGKFNIAAARSAQRQQEIRDRRDAMSAAKPAALAWIDTVLNHHQFAEMNEARNALTHSKLPAHWAMTPYPLPNKRYDLDVLGKRIPVRQIVVDARDFGTSQVVDLVSLLPSL